MPDVLTGSFEVEEGGRSQSQREIEDALLLVLKMEEGAPN